MPKNALVFALLLPASAMALAAPPPTSPPPAPEPALPEILVPTSWLLERLDAPGIVVLDVAGDASPSGAHVPGAHAWTGAAPSPGAVPCSSTVVLYDRAPGPSPRLAEAFWRLERAGYDTVKILRAGLDGWRRANGPLAGGPPPAIAPGARGQASDDGPAVEADWLLAHFGEPDVAILDVRDGEGWRVYRLSRRFRAGHVPHSLPFSPASLVAADGEWPDPRSLRAEIATLGPRAREPVDPHSTFVLLGSDRSDPEVHLGYLLFRTMGLDVRVYEEGWEGWSARSDTPVVRVVGAPEVRWLLTDEPGTAGSLAPPENILVLDLRESWYYEQGHVPGARLLPADDFEHGFERVAREALGDFPADTLQLVLYCFGPSCTRSRECGTQAARLGVRHILWFRGGIDEWRDHGYPVATGAGTSAGAGSEPAPAAGRPSPEGERPSP